MPGSIERAEVEILDRATNETVLRLPWRRYPGVLLQGDTLNGRRAELREAIESLRAADTDNALDALSGLEEWLGSLLSHYEGTLASAGIDLPYAKG